ncbi:MAG TPA: LOG family protein, partial [Beijerinckiaceae bacterium]|nr:LOG family protein [Beijerinckiaceae bacterium]
TLEELVEQMTWAQLGQHTKPILMLSVNGFWRPLLQLFAHMRQFGFIRPGLELNYLVAEEVEDVLPMLAKAARRAPETKPGRVASIEQRF